jgi:hypothetical protein
MTEHDPKQVPKQVPKHIPEEMLEQIPEQIPEQIAEEPPEETPPQIGDEMVEDIAEQTPEQIPEQIWEIRDIDQAATPDGAQALSGQRIREAASKSVREGADIRAKVHDVTLLALKSRRFDRHGMREVVQAVTEGVALGAEQSRTDLRQALSEAFRGLDEALTRSADAGRAALRQLATTGKDFSDSELKQTLATMKKLEDDFLSTAAHVAEAASEKVRPELRQVIDTARTTGTDTGKMVAGTLTEFARRSSVASLEVALAGLEAANEFGTRFAKLASGILSGIADALAEPRSRKKQQ